MLAVAATALTVFGLVLLPSSPSGDRAANTLVAHGQVDGWPALWKSTDGREWHESLLPWEGSVQAVAISFDRLVVLGIDSRRGREIVARSLDQGWAVQAADAPDTGLVSTGTGFVGRGRLVDGTTGYLYSRDGLTWEPVGSALSLHESDVASLHYEGGATILRTPGVAGDTRPPDTPVSALWRVGERIWVQTPGVVWSSTDGTGCSPLRLDRRNGIGHGAPLRLPFEDRALVSVGGARGVPRQIFTWILGA